jgi:hypothetical protein
MNIFEISSKLSSIIDELEENGGELTEELSEKLTISQQEFKDKIENYLNVIKNIDADVEACDKEIKRLQSVKKTKQNTIERLKTIVCWAIDEYGETNKSGNKYVDLGKSKVTVKAMPKVIVNDEYADSIINKVFKELIYVNDTKELKENAIKDLLTVDENKVNGITVNLSIDVPLKDLYDNKGDSFVKSLFAYNTLFKYKSNISKSELKDKIKNNIIDSNLAHIENNKSLIIK